MGTKLHGDLWPSIKMSPFLQLFILIIFLLYIFAHSFILSTLFHSFLPFIPLFIHSLIQSFIHHSCIQIIHSFVHTWEPGEKECRLSWWRPLGWWEPPGTPWIACLGKWHYSIPLGHRSDTEEHRTCSHWRLQHVAHEPIAKPPVFLVLVHRWPEIGPLWWKKIKIKFINKVWIKLFYQA